MLRELFRSIFTHFSIRVASLDDIRSTSIRCDNCSRFGSCIVRALLKTDASERNLQDSCTFFSGTTTIHIKTCDIMQSLRIQFDNANNEIKINQENSRSERTNRDYQR